MGEDKQDTAVVHVGINAVLKGADHDDLIKPITDIGNMRKRYEIKSIWFNLYSREKKGHFKYDKQQTRRFL